MAELIGTISVCVDCLGAHVNGDVGPDRPEPLSLIEPGYSVTAGTTEHAEGCGDFECDCDHLGFSWSPCQGCGSALGGDRFALTLWRD